MNIDIEDNIAAGYFQMGSVAGVADSITMRLTATAPHKMRCAIYTSSNVLLCITEELTVPVQDKVNTTFNITGVNVLYENQWYYIAVWSEQTVGVAGVWYTPFIAGANIGYLSGTVYGSYPDPIVWESVIPLLLLDGYCTYTEHPELHYVSPNKYCIDGYPHPQATKWKIWKIG